MRAKKSTGSPQKDEWLDKYLGQISSDTISDIKSRVPTYFDKIAYGANKNEIKSLSKNMIFNEEDKKLCDKILDKAQISTFFTSESYKTFRNNGSHVQRIHTNNFCLLVSYAMASLLALSKRDNDTTGKGDGHQRLERDDIERYFTKALNIIKTEIFARNDNESGEDTKKTAIHSKIPDKIPTILRDLPDSIRPSEEELKKILPHGYVASLSVMNLNK